MINRLARARVALKAKPFIRHYPSKTPPSPKPDKLQASPLDLGLQSGLQGVQAFREVGLRFFA